MNKNLEQIKIKIVGWLKNATKEKKSCGRCGVCHHVCDLLGKSHKLPEKREG